MRINRKSASEVTILLSDQWRDLGLQRQLLPPACFFFARYRAVHQEAKGLPLKSLKTSNSLSSAKLRGRWYIHVKDHRDQKSWLAEKSDFPPWFWFVNVQNTFESPTRVKLFPGIFLIFVTIRSLEMYCDVNSPTSSVLHISKFPFWGYCSLPRFFVRYGTRRSIAGDSLTAVEEPSNGRTKAMTQVNIISCFAWFIDDWAQRWSLHNSVPIGVKYGYLFNPDGLTKTQAFLIFIFLVTNGIHFPRIYIFG